MRKTTFFFLFLILILVGGCDLAEAPLGEILPTRTVIPASARTFLDKNAAEDVRLFTYNVYWDSIFPENDRQNNQWYLADKSDAFRRLIAAVNPDIACLQEIGPNRDPGQVSEIFDEVLPLGGRAEWQAVLVYDTVIVSRFDLQSRGYELYSPLFVVDVDQAAALIDLPDAGYGEKDLYLICAHFAASGDQASINRRQTQADALIRQVGDLKTEGDQLDLAENTPFVFAGDFNVYDTDPAHHLVTLLTGDIVNEDQFGTDVQPDWDGTWLADVLPSQNGAGELFYTWQDEGSSFNPGTLDRVIYTDSVMSVSNAYVLNTTTLSPELLARYGLRAEDVVIDPETGFTDHFPMIVDFSIPGN